MTQTTEKKILTQDKTPTELTPQERYFFAREELRAQLTLVCGTTSPGHQDTMTTIIITALDMMMSAAFDMMLARELGGQPDPATQPDEGSIPEC